MPRTTIRSEDITDLQVKTADVATGEITTAKMATDPTNASNLSSGSVPLAQLGNAPATDVTGIEADIALLAFKTQANGNLARYNLVDQSVDAFESAAGVDASASTAENYESTAKYYSGKVYGVTSFTSTGTVVVPASISAVNLLVVAGGGGGGSGDRVGGGGAGGVVYVTSHAVTGGNTYTATVAAGVAAQYDGNDSTWTGTGTTTITAKGGGAAGGRAGNGSFQVGVDGGSGGGGAVGKSGGSETQTGQGGVSGSSGYGNDGGAGSGGAGNDSSGGGGGGAGGAGGDGAVGTAADGGAGYNATGISWIGTTFGVSGYFAGGGAGSIWTGTTGTGGTGGGGNGGTDALAGFAGTPNTGGGGGGGGGGSPNLGGTGATGIIIVNWSGDVSNMTLVSTSTTAEAVPTKGDIVITYTNGAGTATINTDIKAYVSRDNGTTYTQLTLVDQGDTGGHTILTAHDVDISSQPSGSTMLYKIETLNQSASKETRIQAVSLGWS